MSITFLVINCMSDTRISASVLLRVCGLKPPILILKCIYEMHGCLKWIKYMKNYLSPGKSRANQLVYIKIQYGQMFVDHLQD